MVGASASGNRAAGGEMNGRWLAAHNLTVRNVPGLCCQVSTRFAPCNGKAKQAQTAIKPNTAHH